MKLGTNSAMPCAEIHAKAVLAVYGELADDEAHRLTQHLAVCSECRADHEQLLALKTLAAAYPVQEPDANLVARSRTRLEEALDALPPKRWYDRLAEWMTRTATGLQAAPVAACLLLVAGAGLGSIGGFEFSQRQSIRSVTEKVAQPVTDAEAKPTPVELPMSLKSGLTLSDVASVSEIVRQPNSDRVEVSFNQVERRRMQGTLHDAPIRQLLMLASQNGSSPQVRDDSVSLLAAACRAGEGCEGKGVSGGAAGDDIRDVLMVALRYDRSAAVRQKALNGLQPYVGEDMRVRNAVLETLLNDPDAHIRSTAISMLDPVEADTSVRQVLSTVALSDQNPHIRDASRLVLRRVSEIQ